MSVMEVERELEGSCVQIDDYGADDINVVVPDI